MRALTSKTFFTATTAAIALLSSAGTSMAQTAETDQTAEVDEIVVTAHYDPLGRLQKSATDSFTGLDRSMYETPRSVSRVSMDTIDSYGMENVDDLVAAVPGAYTASFFGVPGNLNVRGTLADTYFQGFKRIENRGSFSSNLGAASFVEVLRGPSSPIYGPGKVGGLLNFVPKSARGNDGRIAKDMAGGFDVTLGSYGKQNVSADWSCRSVMAVWPSMSSTRIQTPTIAISTPSI